MLSPVTDPRETAVSDDTATAAEGDLGDIKTPPAGAEEAAVAGEVAEGDQVAWTDEDGERQTGVVVSVEGDVVTVTPDDGEGSIEVALADVEVVDDDEGGDTPEEAEIAGWVVTSDHPQCNADPDTTAPVAVVAVDAEGNEVALDSCHPDEAAAEAQIASLEAAKAADDDDAEPEEIFENGTPQVPVGEETGDANAPSEVIAASGGKEIPDAGAPKGASMGTAYIDFEARGLDEVEGRLQAAVGLAEGLMSTLGRLGSIDPKFAPDVQALAADAAIVAGPADGPAPDGETAPEPTPEPEVAPVALADRSNADLVHALNTEGGLADVDTVDIIAELGRRFAKDVTGQMAADDEPSAEPGGDVDLEEGAGPADAETYDAEGVLIVEGIPSGDGRQIEPGALTHRDLPLPLMLQTVVAAGHDGAVIAGSIHKLVRDGEKIRMWANFDSGDDGQKAMRLLSEGTMRGISADIDSVIVEFRGEDGSTIDFEDVMMGAAFALEVLVAGRIMGGTLTPFPAFQEAHVTVIKSEDTAEALVASGGVDYRGDVWQIHGRGAMWAQGQEATALVASAAAEAVVNVVALSVIPTQPPLEWFAKRDMPEAIPFSFDAQGRGWGLVAQWGTTHIGFMNKKVPVPRTQSAYSHFMNKQTLTAEGIMVATGPMFMDTVHPDLKLVASDVQAHYADTGCAVADVVLYENEWGIVAAGAARPTATPEQMRVARGSDWSPDWRMIDGNLEAVGVLAVNVSGFVVQGLVASGAEESGARGLYDSVRGEVTALVAAGMVTHGDVSASKHAAEIAELRGTVEDMAAAFQTLVLAPAKEARLARAREAVKALSEDEPTPMSAEARRQAVKDRLAAFA